MPETTSVKATQDCIHCGTPFSRRSRPDSEFCCNGCEYVHKLIRKEGFEHYYELRDKRISPVSATALQKRDFVWLEKTAAAAAEKAPGKATARFDLEGISCIGCVWLVEKIFHSMPGAIRIEINTQYGQMQLEWKPGLFPIVEFAKEVQQFGYVLGPPGERDPSESRRLIVRLGIAAACAMNGMLFTLPRYLGMEADFELAGLFEKLALLFATISLIAAGSYFIKRGLTGIARGVLHIDFPIAIGILAAYAGSLFGWLIWDTRFLYFDFVAIFIFLMLIGRYLQERSLETNRNRLLSQSKAPQSVTIVGDGLEDAHARPLDELETGQRFRLLPGEINPVLAVLDSNVGAASLEWINGESEMREFSRGQLLPAGAQNIGIEPVLLIARQTWSHSTLRRLIERRSDSGRDSRTEQFLRFYLVAILIMAMIGLLSWGLLSSQWITGLQVALSVLVVSCPCALGVALPLSTEIGTLRMRQKGIFIRNSHVYRNLAKVRQVVFDKTGTLTLEAPILQNPDSVRELKPIDRAVLRAMVETSLHPVSKAIREALLSVPDRIHSSETDPLETLPGDLHFTETIGSGITAISLERGLVWRLGKATFHPNVPNDHLDPEAQTHFSRRKGSAHAILLANFLTSDALREDAPAAIQQLARKMPVTILSGDREDKVVAMASQLGIPKERAIGNRSPEGKAAFLESTAALPALFVGDGANDALAFQRAAVRGTPATPHGMLNDPADFFFTGRSLSGILDLLRIARDTRVAASRVIAFSIGYNFITVSIALAGYMHPLLAAILMPLSSIASIAIFKTSQNDRTR